MQQEFGGTRRLYSDQGVERLRRATVTIIGVGGVGSWVAEALARSSIGHIVLIDMDDICVTNTNRQIHTLAHTTDTINATVGKLKVEAMAERIRAINSQCKVTPIMDFLNKDNLADYLSIQSDYVVDAIDNARVKAAVIKYCKRNKIKIITIGGAGAQIDPLKIQVADLSRTWQDPLSAKVRNELRRNHGFSKNPKRRFSVECVYSTEQLLYPNSDGTVGYQKPANELGGKLDCAKGLGASVVVTAAFGMVATSRVINWLVRKDTNDK
ncbi:MAG: tRNA cyclic N6-threonylcarbamoyladenosine(37) synthase TcdA [Kangiellaceae bacterium]|nr:tRNA cyclic N6-threonylcarbamoyladenosine(37) synthase TcdA [Kangiellaceae bacterium]